MKIVQINCVYNYGSTGKITRDIHQGLLAQGYESVVLYGRRQKTKEQGIHKTCTEFEAKACNVLSRVTGRPYAAAPLGTAELLCQLDREKPDIVHLQCINGYFVNIYRLLDYLKNHHIPTILTLHAEFMYTGNCSYAYDCDGWKTGCTCCPDQKEAINSTRTGATEQNWKQMQRAFAGFENLLLCPVSDWVGSRAAQSPILNQYPIRTVLNGIDTGVFHYRKADADALRKKLNIGDRKLVLHVTASYANPIKGGKFITEQSKMLDGTVCGPRGGRREQPRPGRLPRHLFWPCQWAGRACGAVFRGGCDGADQLPRVSAYHLSGIPLLRHRDRGLLFPRE